MKTDEIKRSRTGSFDHMIADMGGAFSRSSSASSFYRSDSEKIDRENSYNLADLSDEINLAEPAPRTIMDWAYELIDRLSYNCSHFFGLDSCVSSPGDDCIERDRPQGKCAEIACSAITYLFTLFSLATIGAGAMGISGVFPAMVTTDADYLLMISISRYLIPTGVFVYSFIFSLDKRPPQLVKLFLDLTEVRAILTKGKELKYEIKLETENDYQLTTPLLISAQKNFRRVRGYEDLKPAEKNRVRVFAGLLRKVINPNGSTGQWFYDSNRTGEPDKWKNMRVYGLYMKTRIPGCDLYLISEFNIKKCEEIKGDAVILTNNNNAYFFLNDKIAMEDDKPQVVQGINRQNIALSQSIEPISFKGWEWKKWRIFKESIQKAGHAKKIVSHLHDRDLELLQKLQQEFSREQDIETLNIIVTGSEYIIKKKHLETLYDMMGALTYANKNNYLCPPYGHFTKLMNRNNLFRWSTFLFTTGSTVVIVMMSLNLCLITTRFLNRYGRDSIADGIKANNNAAIIIFVSPIVPGILALWARLNTIPVFDTSAQGLLSWLSRSVCYNYFHRSRILNMNRVVNLSIFGFIVGLLISQPLRLDNKVLIFTGLSYYAAKLFAMLPNLFQNYLGRRLGPGENKLRNSELPSKSSSQPPGSSTEMKIISSQESDFPRKLSSDSDVNNNDNRFKLFLPKPDFENKYNSDNNKKSKIITLENPVAEDSTDSNIEYSPFH